MWLRCQDNEIGGAILGRGKSLRIFPDLALESVWDDYTQEPSKKSDAYHLIVYKNLQYFDQDIKERILNDLVQIDTDSMRRNDRLRYVREKIADLVDRRVSGENKRPPTDHGDDQQVWGNGSPDRGLDLTLADCNLKIAMLRAYTRGKYCDVHRDDWFAMYLYLTEFYHDQMLTGQTGGPDPGFIFEGQRLEPTSENFQLCREKCLDAYVGQTFDIPADNSSRLLKFLRKIRRKPIWRKLIS